MNKGLILVHTGDGKGKTTAAVGLGVRAVGAGLRVLMVQFIKSHPSGELISLEKFDDAFEVHQMGEGFTWKSKDLEKDAATAMSAWEFCVEKIRSGRYQLLILDEINIALHHEFLPLGKVLKFLREKDPALHVVLTGRNAKQELMDIADTVTEMKEVKHHYKKKVKAQKGIEF
jgi:cob(I)alamin adenosyltransferase